MVASNAAIVADWAQIRDIADHANYYEKNSYLGTNPRSGKVNHFFINTLIFHNVVGMLTPEKYRSVYYGGQLGFRLSVVKDNANIGIEFKF